MAEVFAEEAALRAEELDRMHALYRQGGQKRQMAPHIVYPEASCPHEDCDQPMQAIDFRLEDHGRAVHDPLVTPGGMTSASPVVAPGVAAGSTSPSAARPPSRRSRQPGIPSSQTTGTPGRRYSDLAVTARGNRVAATAIRVEEPVETKIRPTLPPTARVTAAGRRSAQQSAGRSRSYHPRSSWDRHVTVLDPANIACPRSDPQYRRWDLNPHPLYGDRILSPARLP